MTGWSLKRIQREAHLREWASYGDDSSYHPLRDGPRLNSWTWAIDAMRDEGELSEDAWRAATDFVRAQLAARGDAEHHDRPRVDGGAPAFDTAIWTRMRAEAIERAVVAHVSENPDCSPMRWATFCCAFHWRQPTLAHIRIHGRPGGARTDPATGAYLRMNESKTKARIAWCAETIAEHFASITATLGRAAG